MTDCELCHTAGGDVLWEDDFCRVVLVDDAHYSGFCRVILNRHVKEMSDLDEQARQRLMAVVFTTEAVLREVVSPDKINLASLGNVVPHLHWHVISRFVDDKHFPNPVWGSASREGTTKRDVDRQALKTRLSMALDQPARRP